MARPRPSTSQRTAQPPRAFPVPSIAAWELAGLGVLLVLGMGLRLAYLGDSTVEHFDEGVYASNLWLGPDADYQYPDRHLYAPPLLSWLIDWSMVVHGAIEGGPAMWPSLLAGVATIFAVWCLARWLGGPLAALASSGLATISGLHVLLSRAALTDCLLGLWVVAALLAYLGATRIGSLWPFAASGVGVGLAWLTKYNGWLPLFILLVANVSYLLVGSTDRRVDARRFALRWGLTTLVSLALWVPYWWSLADRGGYAAVAANHRKYLVGLSGWWESLQRQTDSLFFLGGVCNADVLAILLGFCGSVLVLCCSSNGGLLAPASGVIGRLKAVLRAAPFCVCGSRDVPVSVDRWTIAVGYLLLAAMTPLYTPYPRLMLPWLIMAWLAAGVFLGRMIGPPGSRRAVLVVGLLVLAGFTENVARGTYWPNRTGWQRIAEEITREVQGGPPADIPTLAIYTYGEPALMFQLRAAGVAAVRPIQSLSLTPAMLQGQPLPTFLAVGPHALRDPRFQEEWPQQQARYQLVKTYEFTPSPLVLLDNFSARELRQHKVVEEVRLYRVISR